MKLLKAGAGFNLFIFVMASLSIGLEIHTLIVGIAFILFVISIIAIKKKLNFGRYFGMAASLIIILIFLKTFFPILLSPMGMTVDLPHIITIFAPFFYCFIFGYLIVKKL